MLKPRLRRHKWLWILGTLAVLLIAVRVALPSIVKDIANDRLMALEHYDGHVLDVDLALWRGAYPSRASRSSRPARTSRRRSSTVTRSNFPSSGRACFADRWWPKAYSPAPTSTWSGRRTSANPRLGKGQDWRAAARIGFPFRFNTVKVVDGIVTFRAPGIRAKDALEASHINGVISNITNVVESDRETYTFFQGQAAVLKTGSARLNGTIDPFAGRPAFDLNLTVKNVRLPEVNPWLRQYIKADAEDGEFELYTELAAKDGRFTGYAKPIMRDVNIYSSKEEEDNPLRRLWEGIVDFAAEIVEDEGSDQIAARVPFSGTVENPDAGMFETIVSVLKNAFVSAFARSLEDSISLRDVEKKLGKIGKDEKKKKAENRE